MSGSRFGRLIEGFRRSLSVGAPRGRNPARAVGLTKGLVQRSANERKRHEHTHIDSLELVATHTLELIAYHNSTPYTARL